MIVWTVAVKSCDEAIQYRKGMGTDTTHWRTGTQGIRNTKKVRHCLRAAARCTGGHMPGAPLHGLLILHICTVVKSIPSVWRENAQKEGTPGCVGGHMPGAPLPSRAAGEVAPKGRL